MVPPTGTFVTAPPVNTSVGFELLDIDPDEGTIEVEFEASTSFLNPAGHIQGGFLAAMLDDTLGPALVATLAPDQFAPTLDLHVQFVRPAKPGRITGRGHVVNKGRAIAFLAGELTDADGALLANTVSPRDPGCTNRLVRPIFTSVQMTLQRVRQRKGSSRG